MVSELKHVDMYFEYLKSDGSVLSQEQATFMLNKFVSAMKEYSLRNMVYHVDENGNPHVSTETVNGENLHPEFQSGFSKELARLITVYELDGIDIQLPCEVL